MSGPDQKEWKKLYQAAVKFKELKCWEWMYDKDIFGVKNPDSGEIGYCSVMGMNGDYFALGVYLGTEGLLSYWSIHENPDSPDNLFNQKCLIASFEDRGFLQKNDLDLIKSLGLKFRGRNEWPFFRNHLPGYFPWYLNKDEVIFLTHCLEQAVYVCKMIRAEELYLPPVMEAYDEYLIRTPNKKNGKLSWTNEIHKPKKRRSKKRTPIKLDDIRLKKILTMADKGNSIWEIDVFYNQNPIQENKKERPYFCRNIMVVDGRMGLILNNGLATESEYPEKLVDTILHPIEAHKTIPEKILVTNESLHLELKDFSKQLGIKLSKVDGFQSLHQAKGMMNAISNVNSDEQDAIDLFFQSEAGQALANIFENLKNQSQADGFIEDDFEEGDTEFIDDDHPFDEEYYEIMDDPSIAYEVKEKKLLKLIKKDPNYYDPYVSLYHLYNQEGNVRAAEKIILKAYNNSLEYVSFDDDQMPEELSWGYVENRHILRVFITSAIHHWKKKENEDALNTFRMLLDLDPDDSAGNRLFILAIKMKLSFEEFDKKFVENGVYSNKVFDWFDKNYRKFPDDFPDYY